MTEVVLTKVIHCMTINKLKTVTEYEYSLEKDSWLIAERGIGFEDIVSAIERGCLLKTIDHHNHQKYPHQQFLLVMLNDYIYSVPFVFINTSRLFLKTIFRNRKQTKKYLN